MQTPITTGQEDAPVGSALNGLEEDALSGDGEERIRNYGQLG